MAAVFLRRISAVIALLAVACTLLVASPPAPALADPEGGSKTLRDALESAAKGQADALQKLAASKQRQAALRTTIAQAEAGAKALEGQVATIAARSYRYGRTSALSMLLQSTSPNSFLERVQGLDMLAQLDGRVLARYRSELARAQQAKAAVDREIQEQQKQVAALAKKKREAEIALGTVGGGGRAGGFLDAKSPLARPAPRNSDGSWPRETCTVNDPTTSGCLTPRTVHAYVEARAAGFRHYTS